MPRRRCAVASAPPCRPPACLLRRPGRVLAGGAVRRWLPAGLHGALDSLTKVDATPDTGAPAQGVVCCSRAPLCTLRCMLQAVAEGVTKGPDAAPGTAQRGSAAATCPTSHEAGAHRPRAWRASGAHCPVLFAQLLLLLARINVLPPCMPVARLARELGNPVGMRSATLSRARRSRGSLNCVRPSGAQIVSGPTGFQCHTLCTSRQSSNTRTRPGFAR